MNRFVGMSEIKKIHFRNFHPNGEEFQELIIRETPVVPAIDEIEIIEKLNFKIKNKNSDLKRIFKNRNKNLIKLTETSFNRIARGETGQGMVEPQGQPPSGQLAEVQPAEVVLSSSEDECEEIDEIYQNLTKSDLNLLEE
jgi:hypothetical protein